MKRTIRYIAVWGWVIVLLATAASAHAQRPYIGYAYPAGAQQGTTVQVRLGGQGLNDLQDVTVSGKGIRARVVEYQRRLNNQEIALLNEQLKILKAAPGSSGTAKSNEKPASSPGLASRIEERVNNWEPQPASAAISNLAIVEIAVSPDAEPGMRDIRLMTARGISNPLAFHIGQFREYSRKPMKSAKIQTLGKEAAALRKRPDNEAEVRVSLPCTANGQIASGEVNSYRFEARKGQRLVFSVQARRLVPYIADAVPGWFQPVIAIYNSQGREVAFNDDYRFQPDPVIVFTVPESGEYVCTMRDSIYRGREDFVYRLTMGEFPFITSLFPLGGQSGAAFAVNASGVNLAGAKKVSAGGKGMPSGIYSLTVPAGGLVSNALPYAIDDLPETFEKEPNNTIKTAQRINLPRIINGRIDRRNDCDVFRFTGKAGQVVAMDVMARRLDSPLDSLVKLTDAKGRVLGVNDDVEDLSEGLQTHQADSNLVVKLPADGVYYIHLSDTARKGGPEYGYRLRVSEPRPDFRLRAVPSGMTLRVNGAGTLTVYAARRDGYIGPIKLALKNPPPGFSAQPVTIQANRTSASFTVKAPRTAPEKPVDLMIMGSAKAGDLEVVRDAIAAEDRMQAFLWRHLLPAADLKVQVIDPAKQPAKRPAPTRATAPLSAKPAVPAATATVATSTTPTKPKFTKQQIDGRLRQLRELYDDGLLTDAFYDAKVLECTEGLK